MNILFITHYSLLYGANRSLIGIIEGLGTKGIHATVAVPELDGEIAKYCQDHGVPTLKFPFYNWGTYQSSDSPDSFSPRGFIRDKLDRHGRWKQAHEIVNEVLPQVRAVKPDLVYTNSAVTPIGFLIAEKLSLKHVWHIRENCDLHYGLKLDLGKALSSCIIRKSDRIFCISNYIKRHYFGSLARKNIKVIYNGVYSENHIDQLFRQHRDRGRKSRDFVFILVGVLHINKQQETAVMALVEAKKSCKNIGLIIVGGGDEGYLEHLKSLVESHGVADSVDFTGYVSDPAQYYVNADCALMCSEHEGFGRVTAEAMAVGLPVIGNNSGGTPEIIENGINGFLYEGSVKELAEKMIYLAKNRAKARDMGALGHAKARALYSTEYNSQSIYRNLMDICSG